MRIFVLLICLCIPVAGFAQNVTVRSGEHADFSRLAFEFSGEINWEMGRIESGYQIRLQGVSGEIDISEVFQRIPRDRIENLSISGDNARISIGLGCDCYADAFEFRPGLLVVDVKDGAAPIASRFERAFGVDEAAAGQVTQVQEAKESRLNPTGILHNRATVDIPLRLPKPDVANSPQIDLLGTYSAERMQQSTKQVSEMQLEILQQIGHAASQGLLDANIPNPIVSAPSDHSQDEVLIQVLSRPTVEPRTNVHIESSIDREFEGFLRQNLLTDKGEQCLPDRLFNVSEWGDESSVLTRISEQRRQVFGEFDKIDQLAVRRLVKAYIYAGFGAEALSVISSFEVDFADKNTLKTMAGIVDGNISGQHGKLSRQLDCDSASAMWAALSVPSLSKYGQINTVSILGTFSGLPVHLRRLLGPVLAQKFLKSGDIETARALKNAIARVSGEAGAEFHLLDAQLDLERGKDEVAEQKLEDIVVSDQGVAPRALIELLEVRLQKGEVIAPQILATAESYIFEQQDTETAAKLKQLIALSMGQAGHFLEALDALNELETYAQMEREQKTTTWEKVIENLVEHAPEALLLQFVFAAQEELAHQNFSRQTRRKLASRLVKEGWPIRAEKILAATNTPTADDRIILARAGNLNRQSGRVLKILENVAGKEAAQARALAYENSGDYLAAAQEYRRIRDIENQKEATWRAEDWAQLEEIGSEVTQSAAKLMSDEQPLEIEPALTTVGTIAYDRLLLSKSEEERQSIAQLLEEYPAFVPEES